MLQLYSFVLGVVDYHYQRELILLQNFTANSDIDWSKSVAEIDRQLYAKYGLSEEEVSFVEKMIKPMECCYCIFCKNVVYYKQLGEWR